MANIQDLIRVHDKLQRQIDDLGVQIAAKQEKGDTGEPGQSIKGPKGDKGDPGKPGAPGADGPRGKDGTDGTCKCVSPDEIVDLTPLKAGDVVTKSYGIQGTAELRDRITDLERISLLRLHGGVYALGVDTTTTITTADTWTEAVGVLAPVDLNFGFTPDATNMGLLHAHTEPEGIAHTYDIDFSLNVESGTGDEVCVLLRIWDDSESAYTDLIESCTVMTSAPGGIKQGHLNLTGRFSVTTDDRVEVWLKNVAATNNILVKEFSTVGVRGI